MIEIEMNVFFFFFLMKADDSICTFENSSQSQHLKQFNFFVDFFNFFSIFFYTFFRFFFLTLSVFFHILFSIFDP